VFESLTALWPGLLALTDVAPAVATAPAAPLWSVASLISLATLAASGPVAIREPSTRRKSSSVRAPLAAPSCSRGNTTSRI